MKRRFIAVEPGEKVYIVFAAKRWNCAKNIVFKAEAKQITIDKKGIKYLAEMLLCVVGKENVEKYKRSLCFENVNVDTGYTGLRNWNCYPVFTTKEKCIEWLRG